MSRKDSREKFPDNGFEAWGGYMRAKIAKLEEQYATTACKDTNKVSNIFKGVSIFVNGYTIPSADELKEIMVKHGGTYHTYQRSEDFLIASNLPDTKVKNMSLAKVVKPEWITDSIKSNSLLDYRNYLLYRHSKAQMMLNFPLSKKDNKDEVKMLKKLDNKFVIDHDIVDNCLEMKHTVIPSLDNSENKAGIHKNDLYDVKIFNSMDNNLPNNTKAVKNHDTMAKTANDPNFIAEFYNNSRLHHISQLGAHFKQYINELREQSSFRFPLREELKKRIFSCNQVQDQVALKFQNNKIIMHIDMDCFFVSVGLRNRPELNGKPVAVTHSKGGQSRQTRLGVDRETEFSLYKQRQAKHIGKVTGFLDKDVEFESKTDNVSNNNDEYGSMSEIASCSYEARAKGIKNGMLMGAALKLCPNLQTIPYDFEGYKEVAHTLYNTIAQYTLDIEAVSCDEMYVDCTDLLVSTNISVVDFAYALREEIKEKTGCPCSTGFGGNRLQARLATKQAKPNGQFFLTIDLVNTFMYNVKLIDLPGVGRQTAHKLQSLGHETCGSLQNLTLGMLQQHFGNKTGAQLFDQCRGNDPNHLCFYTIRKSVSAEVNYGIRFENHQQCEEFLKQLSTEVHSRMTQFKVLGKCVTLKLMVRAQNAPIETAKFLGHGFCDVINKSTTLHLATNDLFTITKEVLAICRKLNIDPKEMRGVGIQISKLESLQGKDIKNSLNKFIVNVKTEDLELNSTKDLRSRQNVPEHSKQIGQPITSYKEQNSTSPLKKSHITIHIKSPVGKKRGRPIKTKHQISSSNNLMDKFLQGQTIGDMVLRNEVANKDIIVKEKPCDKGLNQGEDNRNQGLLPLSWQKVRQLLRAWFDSGQTPKSCDVNLIIAYMQDMVINKNIENLNILIKFMRRRVHEIDSPVWYEVEKEVVEQVQNTMLGIYGKKLWICQR